MRQFLFNSALWLRILRFALLLAITAAAFGVMAWSVIRSDPQEAAAMAASRPDGRRPELPPTAVSVRQIEPGMVELVNTYSGMIRPWERYHLSFEIPGRVRALGSFSDDRSLDEGDRVEKGQVLAWLDNRTLKARHSEAVARLEQASSKMSRARQLQKRQSEAITETELQDRLTELSVAKAEYEMAKKNLEDAVLVSPADAIISKRTVNAGESVSPHQRVFELIELDKVLLVLGVPESDIVDIQARSHEVARNQDRKQHALVDDEDLQFNAYVELIGRDRFGNRRQRMTGTVHHISDDAEEKTGLFAVEVTLPNPEGILRPGMVARADLVISRVKGHRVPATSVVFREGEGDDGGGGKRTTQAFLFAVEDEKEDVRAMFFPVGQRAIARARRVDLVQWVEQRGDVVVLDASHPIDTIVERGQHRLVDNQRVKVVSDTEAAAPAADVAAPPAAAQAKRD